MDAKTARAEFEDFFAGGKQVEFARKDVIVHADTPTESAYWIQDGYVKVVSYADSGSERNHFIFGPGELFPISRLFGRSFSELSYAAASDLQAKSRPISDLRVLIKNEPAIMHYLVDIMLHTVDRIYCLHLERAQDRVMYTLLNLTERFGVKSGHQSTLDLSLKQQEFADLVRLTRESVGKIFSKLEEQKCIIVGSKYIMVDTPKLKKRLAAVSKIKV